MKPLWFFCGTISNENPIFYACGHWQVCAPFGLQFYCNGHSALACSLKREGIEFVREDNAFLRIADLPRAQALADAFNPERLHRP